MEFKKQYEDFLTRCDEIENASLWDTEELGNMGAYFTNDMCCTLITLIAADGKIEEAEVKFVNDTLDLDYEPDEMREVYKMCRESVEQLFATGFEESKALLAKVDEHLEEVFRSMMKALCDVVSAGDSIVTPEEKEKIDSLRNMI